MKLSSGRLILLACITLLSFTVGAVSHRMGLLRSLSSLLATRPQAQLPLASRPILRDPFVLIAAGQSNAANHGTPRARSGQGAYALAADGLYPLMDPLPGASGHGGSIWSRWSALRRARHPEQEVIVAAVAQGSSAVSDWIGTGAHSRRIRELLPQLKNAGLRADAIVWHQGETESWSDRADGLAYLKSLQQWIDSIRALGIKAPIFICLASRDGRGLRNTTIRNAQASVWDERHNVYAGVDTDTLGDQYRSDGVHFNERGLSEFAKLLDLAIESRSSRKAAGLDVN
jgi:lysophospholipase L1-like esterase